MTTVRATIKGRRLELEVAADWPDGAQVEIRPPVEAGSASRFGELVGQWKEATHFVSSIHEMVSHPAYLQIIGMGKEALPLLVEELRREPDHWFVALQAITGVNPIPPNVQGNVVRMAEAWLSWAERNGL